MPALKNVGKPQPTAQGSGLDTYDAEMVQPVALQQRRARGVDPPRTGLHRPEESCPLRAELRLEAAVGVELPQAPARPFPSSIFRDKNRRDIGKSQSIWTDSKMETAGSLQHAPVVGGTELRRQLVCQRRRAQEAPPARRPQHTGAHRGRRGQHGERAQHAVPATGINTARVLIQPATPPHPATARPGQLCRSGRHACVRAQPMGGCNASVSP
eukprot:COSAG01_NODE_690_length_14219_cov_19.783144_18_plen_213_part_00